MPDWTHVYPAGPGFVSRAGLTNVTQQGKDGSFPQATAVFELVQVLREKMKGGVSLGGQRPLRSPPASSASQTAECWYYTRVQGSWLEAAGAAGLAPGSKRGSSLQLSMYSPQLHYCCKSEESGRGLMSIATEFALEIPTKSNPLATLLTGSSLNNLMWGNVRLLYTWQCT